MDKLRTIIESNPDKTPSQSEYLKLAEKKAGGGVQGTGQHKVKLVGIEDAVNQDYKTKEDIQGFHLLFEENGDPKKYFIPKFGKDGNFHYLVMRFKGIEVGESLILEYKRIEGTFKGYIDVKIEGDDIPIIEDGVPLPEEE